MSDTPDLEVVCLACAEKNVDTRTLGSKLTGHIGGKHRITKAQYIKRWPHTRNDFADRKPDAEHRQKSRVQLQEMHAGRKESKEKARARHAARRANPENDGALTALLDDNKKVLTVEEQKFYEQVYDNVLQAVDRDEMQMPVISSLAYDMVFLKRLRKKQLSMTQDDGGLSTKQLEDTLKACEARIRNQMQDLGISRALQIKNQVNLKSTPASLISGYIDEIERMSPESLKTLELEEKRVLAKMEPRLERFILSQAPTKAPQEPGKSDGAIASLEEALQRAESDQATLAERESNTGDADLPF